MGRYIQQSGCTVTAEELAPFLEPPPPLPRGQAGASSFADESFVLPALTRFGGVPEVTPGGAVLYCFPDLVATGALAERDAPQLGHFAGAFWATQHLREANWQLSRAGRLGWLVLALGLADAAGVAQLTRLLATPEVVARAGADTVAVLQALLPGLQAYAVFFFALPAARWLWQRGRNAAIDARNLARYRAARLLRADSPVGDKIRAARAWAARVHVADARLVFSSDADDAAAAQAQQADEAADFEQRLRQRERSRGTDAPKGS